jgi:hypothetical protein
MWFEPGTSQTRSRSGFAPSRASNTQADRQFRVPIHSLAELLRRIDALDRRGRRLGTGPIRLDVRSCTSREAIVILVGDPPVLDGWKLAAILDHHSEEPTLRPVTALGETLVAASFAPAACEHCGVQRRRSRTFVLSNEDPGELIQVGSSCLRDFLGGHDPLRLCRQAECLSVAREALHSADISSPEPAPADAPLAEFAAHAAHVVREHGWVTRERALAAGEPSTADRADAALRGSDSLDDGDWLLARGAISWAQKVLRTKPALSQWEQDVISVVSDGHSLGPRERGLISALVAVYRRGRARSSHLGHVSETIEVLVLVERARRQSSDRYGAIVRNDLIDGDMNRLVWWQSRGPELAEGQLIRLRGEVAKHTRFSGNAVTVMTRCSAQTDHGAT